MRENRGRSVGYAINKRLKSIKSKTRNKDHKQKFVLLIASLFLIVNGLIAQTEVGQTTASLKNAVSQNQHYIDSLQYILEVAQKEQSLRKHHQLDSLQKSVKSYPVTGPAGDTLFYIYRRLGTQTAQERAIAISDQLKLFYQNDFSKNDSLSISHDDDSYYLFYGELAVMSVSDKDAQFYEGSTYEVAQNFKKSMEASLQKMNADHNWTTTVWRILWAVLVVGIAYFLLWFIGRGYRWSLKRVNDSKDKWLKNFSYNNYTFLSAHQKLRAVFIVLKVVRYSGIVVVLYIALSVVFSIFPVSRDWADTLFRLIWSPFKGIFNSVYDYLPNLFSILVIYIVMKYVIQLVRYVFKEIEAEKLQVSGFHADWASPTFSIVRFLLYAFMFVLIFPLLPGSDSNIFKGVSVFVGILFSLGSSTAIANMVAGLVITYMRPFKIGDRIKIAEVSGDVLEKTLLVTRIKTIKNEIITIPNSSVLSGNTVNYTSATLDSGLILHTTVTIGYDVPWKQVHLALIDAATMTENVINDPAPFVLQTSLDDFYVAYQLNAYTREASKQAHSYSMLHQNIQDVFNERGIEILSPHYRAARDGNASTIPTDYLPADYKAPPFKVHVAQ